VSFSVIYDGREYGPARLTFLDASTGALLGRSADVDWRPRSYPVVKNGITYLGSDGGVLAWNRQGQPVAAIDSKAVAPGPLVATSDLLYIASCGVRRAPSSAGRSARPVAGSTPSGPGPGFNSRPSGCRGDKIGA
jgi:hypothetical protein